MAAPPSQFRAFKRPIVARYFIGALALWLAPSTASAQPAPRVLKRDTVATLARENSPNVVVAQRRIGEARALRVGAGLATTVNPEISGYVGPRFATAARATDFFVGVAWPFDLSGSASQREKIADARSQLAENEASATRRAAVGDALDLWARARGAEERTAIESARLELDRALLRASVVKRAAGTTGDGDVALARALEAQGVARRAVAERDREGLLERLKARVGIGPRELIAVSGALDGDDTPELDVLVARLRNQPSAVRALTAIRVSEGNELLQRKLGMPTPRVTAGGGRDPDSYLHVGVDLPLPIFQRNQTNRAVSAAQTDTARTEYTSALILAEADLRAAYAEHLGARDAVRALQAAMPSVEDAERLASRGYELGQTTLTEVITIRREAAAARLALVDAQVAFARSRIVLEQMAGAAP